MECGNVDGAKATVSEQLPKDDSVSITHHLGGSKVTEHLQRGEERGGGGRRGEWREGEGGEGRGGDTHIRCAMKGHM